MPKKSAIEMMDFNPFLDPLPEGRTGPNENLRVKEEARFKSYLSIGFFRDLDSTNSSQMRYYFYEHRNKQPRKEINTYSSLVELEQALRTDKDIFRNNPKLF